MNDVIAVGYSPNKHIHVICNDAGLKQIPEPLSEYRNGGGNLPNGALIAFNKVNLVALRLMGVLSERDVSGMLKHLK